MKKSTLLILFIFISSLSFCQRGGAYFTSSRIIKSLYGSFGNDNVGYFWGQILVDSSSTLLKSHIKNVKIKSINESTLDSATYYMDDDSGNFTDGFMPGYYDYTITKPGYQPLIIKGFHSYQNQELFIKAILEPGTKENIYIINANSTITKFVHSGPSYIAKFYYGNYSDTTVAYLWGQLFLNTISPAGDSSMGLGKVTFKYRCLETRDSGIAQTDSSSKFGIYFKDGHYNITITSPGYQSIFIKNYYADQDQQSYLDAVLEPGNDESVFTINKDGMVIKE